jgi:hypothetical protein
MIINKVQVKFNEMQVRCEKDGKEQGGNYTGLLAKWGSICGMGRDLPPPPLANQLGAHPAFCTRSTRGSFPKGKATGVHSYPLTT